MNSTILHAAEAAGAANTEVGKASLQRHLEEVIESEEFKGSHRSGRFLKYIVEQAIAGHLESLKERVIGIELFGRSPSYDTGQDAIVRVAASDVRRRLQLHYRSSGSTSEFRINLPQGAYIPEFICDSPNAETSVDPENSSQEPTPGFLPPANDQELGLASTETRNQAAGLVAQGGKTASSSWRARAIFLATLVILLMALILVQWGTFWKASLRIKALPVSVLPWSVLFDSSRPVHLITSDIDIVRIQRLTGSRISVSDYANRNFIPSQHTLAPEDKTYLMPGDKSATLDTQITASIAELAGARLRSIDVKGARDIKFSDLKTDDNFIFLGSPFSDPWFSVFNDQLDFQFNAGDDAGLGAESIRNVHPGPNEQSVYAPKAAGGATGESYAILALVDNPGQYGQVLLLAGISGEGTLAAGRLVTDIPRLTLALKKCRISSSSPLKHFEMLLRVNLMAGSPSEFDVVACHTLPENSSHL